MKVCIIGASGKLGKYMVQQALDRGYEVVGVCRERSVSKLEAFKGRITVIPGATNDRKVIQQALAGCDGVLTVLVPWGIHQYSSGTAQAVLDFAQPGARLIFSCGWHITRDGRDVYPRSLKREEKLARLLGGVTRIIDIDDQIEACRRIFASDSRWTVVRGSDLEEGESQGLPVWSRHVGDPILESNLTRRVDFALFMVEALKNDALIREAPAIVGCQDSLSPRLRIFEGAKPGGESNYFSQTRRLKMNTYRKTAITVGILFIVCSVASILGMSISNPILDGADYLTKLASNNNQIIAGSLIEFVWAATCAGIAIGLYPILRKYNGALALGAVGFRIVEGIFVLIGTLSLLSLLTLSQEFVSAGASAASSYQASGSALVALRDWAHGSIGLIAFALGTLLYSAVLYQSKLIPRWLSGWGFLAAALCLAVTLYSTFNSSFGLTNLNTALNAPIGLQEIVLAVWLIAKGFNQSAIVSGPAKQLQSELSVKQGELK